MATSRQTQFSVNLRVLLVGVLALTLLFTLCIQKSYAQVLFGTVVGNVTDATGSAVPGASVKITEKSTNDTRTVQTNEGGIFDITTVPAGNYQVEISKQGFRGFLTSNILVNQNNVVRVDARLEVGSQSEQVVVSAAAAALQTDRADVHAELDAQALINLPQPTRSYESLIQLIPGTDPPQGQLSGGTNNPSKSMQFAFNGTSTSGANVRIEGVSAMNPWQQFNTTFVPSVEAISDVNVATNATSAEQGISAGVSVNVRLKSGTNQTHGALYGYNIDSFFEANNFFSNASGIKKPSHLVDNDTGGTIGGHIIKDKLFYFGSYEGDFNVQSYSGILTFPAPTQLSGNESASATPINDTSTGSATGTGRTPFPNNMIPATSINPIIEKIVQLIPPTNLPGSLNNEFAVMPTFYYLHKIDTKIDYTPTQKLRVSGRYGYQPYNNQFAPVYGPILGGASPSAFTAACGACNFQQHGATLAVSGSATYVFSPTLVVDATFGVTQAHQLLFPTESTVAYGANVLGISGTNTGPLPWAGGVPNFVMSNFTTMGYSYPALDYKDPLFEYTANVTKVKGAHSIRFGGDISRQHENHIEISPTAFTFTGGVTSLNGGPGANQYNQIADFLLGDPQSEANYTQALQPWLSLRTWEFALYAADSWQVNRKLTVNYGVRWERYPVPTQATKGINFYNPLTDISEECGVGGVSGNCGIKVSDKLFAPSFGIAWRAFQDFVVRAGFSLSPVQNNMASNGLKGYPDELGAIFTGTNSFTTAGNISGGVPVIANPVLTNGQIMVPKGIGNIFTDPPVYKRGYAESFNITLEKEFKGGWLVQSGWVGTHVVHVYTALNINYGQLGGGAASQPLFPYGITGTTSLVDPLDSDVYESIQNTVTKRIGHGLTTRVAYTYSHDITMNTNILIPQYRNYDRYTSALDRPEAFVWSTSYELPFGPNRQYLQHGIAGAIVGGWSINALATHYSGVLLSVSSSTNSCNCPGNSQTANQLVPKVAKVGNGLGGNPYFNPLAFAPVTTASFGNEGFDTLRGPGSNNLDLSIFRDFRIKERLKIQIRGEALNLTNTPHFANPAMNVSNLQLNSAGGVSNLNGYDTITATTPLGRLYDPRYFRFGLRIMFFRIISRSSHQRRARN